MTSSGGIAKHRFALAGAIVFVGGFVWLAFDSTTLPLFAVFAVIVLVLCFALDWFCDRRDDREE
ncbi:MAG: hypothetical protein JXQ29_06025 [Planctomycetes bacterium]|nr:hypothetical protein [Planctomycetota bacterium]